MRKITVGNRSVRSSMQRARWLMISAVLAVMSFLPASGYAGGWSVIDHRLHQEESGIWNPHAYRGLMGVLSVADLGGALWEGSESRLGKTLWQAMDSQLLASSATIAMKYAFRRKRPSETSNPDEWFGNRSDDSFPSFEAAMAASLVTPFVLEYASERPSACGLLLLPLYVGVARIRNVEHWQSDVLAGWAIGVLSGWYAHHRETPILVEVLPQGLVVGLKTHF